MLKECANEISPLATYTTFKEDIRITVGKWQHHTFIKVFVIIHKYTTIFIVMVQDKKVKEYMQLGNAHIMSSKRCS